MEVRTRPWCGADRQTLICIYLDLTIRFDAITNRATNVPNAPHECSVPGIYRGFCCLIAVSFLRDDTRLKRKEVILRFRGFDWVQTSENTLTRWEFLMKRQVLSPPRRRTCPGDRTNDSPHALLACVQPWGNEEGFCQCRQCGYARFYSLF